MNPRAWGRLLAALVTANLDVIGIAAVLLIAEPLVPNGHLLARADLAPWLTLAVALVAASRGAPLGRGPHPMLTERPAAMSSLFRRGALALVAPGLLAWYDVGRLLEGDAPWIAVALTVVTAVLLALGRDAGETAWNPPGIPSARLWGLGGAAAVTAAAGLGRLAGLGLAGIPEGAWLAGLLSLQFLCVGLAAGRPANLRQRLAAGRRDGARVWPVSFPMWLAAVGPALGFFALSLAYRRVSGHDLNFGEAYVVTFFVTSWGAILWRAPTPVAVGILLHEVVPTGGGDAAPDAAAVGFERPPEGALRFTPLRLQRTRAVHPWIVPVRRARIGDLDDPVMPLWGLPPSFPAAHVLGEAAFEPDPTTGAPQWQVLTLHLGGASDTMTLSGDDAQARRIVVLRAFPRLGGPRRPRRATYRWEESVPAESVQVLDGTVDTCQLIDGDVIVMSAEGVARAFEVEMGAPIPPAADLFAYRLPQVEDYAKVDA